MEDPQTFSAPLTALNDTSGSTDKVPISSGQDAKSNTALPDGETNTIQGTDPSKNEGPDSGVKSEAEVEKNTERNRDDKSLEEYHDSSDHKDDSNSSDKIESTTKEADLEANVSASSQTSDTDQKKEDLAEDPNIVDWDGPEDPKNPMNWPAWKINSHIFLVSAITFIPCV